MAMQIQLDRQSAQPLYKQMVSTIQQRIRSGALPSGARLPTVRALAGQLGVTRLTVHSAYSELQSGGWVEATVGRGTFVAMQQEPVFGDSSLGREFSPHGMISDMLRMAQMPGMRSLAMANAASELYPVRDFSRALNDALAHDSAAVFDYTSAQGEPLLRTVLAELVRGRGLHATPDEIVVTGGVTQGLALVARTLATAGDTVFVEQPTYVGAINILCGQGLRPVGVPVDEQGMQTDALEAMLLEHRPRFIYTIPAFQNPSGVCMSAARSAALLALSARHHIPIVEDDIYAAIAFDQPAPPALRARAPGGQVIYLSSFSKAALPGARVGYIVADLALVKRIVTAKQADDLCSPTLIQRALALFIERGHFAAHLRRVIPQYRERRDALLDAMARSFPSSLRWTLPAGGFSIWVALPPGASATDLYLAAIERGVAFAPGDFFFAGPPPAPYMRLSFSAHPPETLREVTRTIGSLLGNHLHRRSFTVPPVERYLPLV